MDPDAGASRGNDQGWAVGLLLSAAGATFAVGGPAVQAVAGTLPCDLLDVVWTCIHHKRDPAMPGDTRICLQCPCSRPMMGTIQRAMAGRLVAREKGRRDRKSVQVLGTAHHSQRSLACYGHPSPSIPTSRSSRTDALTTSATSAPFMGIRCWAVPGSLRL